MTTSFDEIVALAKDRTSAGRRRLAGCFSDAFFVHAVDFSPTEKAMALEIMAALLRDAELEIRRELAKRFSSEPTVPRSLVVGLAHDVIEVARPVLQHSPVLHDSDLVSVIEACGTAHRVAVANRTQMGTRVADALAQTKEPVVSMTLLQNIAVHLPETTLRELAAQAMESPEISHCLALRPELTPDVAEHIYWIVSQELRQQIKGRFDFSPALLDKSLHEVVNRMARRDADPATRRTMAERLIASGAVNGGFLIELLKGRGLDLFTTLLQELTQLQPEALNILFQPEGLESFALVCRALEFGKTETASLIMLVRDRLSGENQFDPSSLAGALATFGRLTVGDAKTVLWQWRSDPDYLISLTTRRMH
jgi:uncharacterized protein (DUF2336 family)